MTTGLAAVHRFLVQHYNLEELHALCFDLGVKYDDLAGATLSGKARELVLWAGRQRKLAELLATLHHDRPTLFEPAGLRLEPPEVARLYGSVDAFESSTAPHSWWTRFRRRPGIFYPTLALAAVLVLVFLVSGLVGIAGGAADAQRQLAAWGLLPPRQAFAPAAEGEALIVIATFQQGQEIVDVGAQDEIRSAIRLAAQEAGLANLRAEVEPAPLAIEDQEGARALGERYHASMVIWGEITGVRVTVNYLNLKQPDFAAARVRIEETERTQLANPSTYSSFITQDLPGQMTFLSLFAVGQSLYSQAQYAESIRAIARAIASIQGGTIEGLAEAHFRLGWLYSSLPDPDNQGVIAYYTAAIGLKPDYAEAYNNRGLARFDSGDLREAIADFDKAIDLKLDYADAYYNRGLARRRSGDLVAAIADYTKVIDLQPNDAGAYNNRGLARLESGNPAEAVADYTKAIELRPDFAAAYYNRGNFRSDSGNIAGAIADYTKAIELRPDYAAAYNNRGLSRSESGDLAGAVADYDKAIDLGRDYADPYYNRAIARSESGDLAGAIADYTKVIELQPDDAEAYNNRGRARFESGDPAGAIADYALATQIAPDYATSLDNLCRTHALLQQGEQALPACERAVALDPQPGYRANRGLAYALVGRYDAAITDLQAYVEWLAQQPGAEARLARPQAWLTALRAGRNPFTPEELAGIAANN